MSNSEQRSHTHGGGGYPSTDFQRQAEQEAFSHGAVAQPRVSVPEQGERESLQEWARWTDVGVETRITQRSSTIA